MSDDSGHKASVRDEFTEQATSYASSSLLTDSDKVKRLVETTKAACFGLNLIEEYVPNCSGNNVYVYSQSWWNPGVGPEYLLFPKCKFPDLTIDSEVFMDIHMDALAETWKPGYCLVKE